MAKENSPEGRKTRSMSADTFLTQQIVFCAAMLYVFGEEALSQIQLDDGKPTFSLTVPSLDAEEYFNEFRTGRLAISDLKSYSQIYANLTHGLKEMNRREELVWLAPRSDAWWASARQAMQERQ